MRYIRRFSSRLKISRSIKNGEQGEKNFKLILPQFCRDIVKQIQIVILMPVFQGRLLHDAFEQFPFFNTANLNLMDGL